MRRLAVLLSLLILPATLLAQSRDDDDWRNRRYRDAPPADAFELTPFIGYRWGGTIFADQTFLFGEDVDVEPGMSLGGSVGIPLGSSGMKLELMANRQSSELETDRGLFDPDSDVADIDVTYMHAGLQIPFARSRNAAPYFAVSAGLANIDPQVSGVSAENRFSAGAGLGVKVPMGRNVSFRFEGRGYYTALEEETGCTFCDYFYNQDFYQGEVNLGLTFSF